MVGTSEPTSKCMGWQQWQQHCWRTCSTDYCVCPSVGWLAGWLTGFVVHWLHVSFCWWCLILSICCWTTPGTTTSTAYTTIRSSNNTNNNGPNSLSSLNSQPPKLISQIGRWPMFLLLANFMLACSSIHWIANLTGCLCLAIWYQQQQQSVVAYRRQIMLLASLSVAQYHVWLGRSFSSVFFSAKNY